MGCAESSAIQTTRSSDTPRPKRDLPREYDVQIYVSQLTSAIQEGDAEFTLRALLNCDHQQRLEISEAYAGANNHTLLDHVKSKSSDHKWQPWVVFTAELLMSTPSKACVVYIQWLLAEEATNEQTLSEVLCSLNQETIEGIVESYKGESDRCLADDVKARCSSEVGEALSGLLAHKEKSEVEDSEHAAILVQAAKDKNLFENNGVFFSHMNTLSMATLTNVFELYLKQYQRDLTVEIVKQYEPGPAQDGLKTIVNVMRTGMLYTVERVHPLLKKTDDHSKFQLCFIILTASKDYLKELKLVYKNTFFEMLAKDMKDEISDETLRKVLLHVVK